ncbi:hypothetical protein SAMN05216480_11929 [Pustulibacterium marinum]|uniref:Uncharacterized protein n=1 Tax=Pustulibacterium marinum TaxID=1224947 RepID=A0A1I7IQ88_9FLAO|nr:hypothetical protein SAMN05216480_11929 [Pustulibacterium marinum]
MKKKIKYSFFFALFIFVAITGLNLFGLYFALSVPVFMFVFLIVSQLAKKK